MSLIQRPSRSRLSATGGLVLALSLASAPAALAQEGPEQAIVDLMAALEAKDFDDLASHFCAEHAGQAAALDMSAMGEAMGVDAATVVDALILDTEITSMEVISQTDTEAVVAVVGNLTTSFDPEKARPIVEGLLASFGMEVTPEAVDAAMADFAGEPTVTSIDREYRVSSDGAGGWLVCDDLSDDGTASSSGAPVESGTPVESAAAVG